MKRNIAFIISILLIIGLVPTAFSAAVTDVFIGTDSITLNLGDSINLVAAVSPYNADNKGVIWSSSNENAVVVDQSGRVMAVKDGTATITAKSLDNSSASASRTITVSTSERMFLDFENYASLEDLAGVINDIPSDRFELASDPVKGKYLKKTGSNSWPVIAKPFSTWTDYTVELDMKMMSGEGVDFQIRRNGSNYYKLYITKGSIAFFKLNSNKGAGTMTNVGVNWFRLKVVCLENKITVYVNGTQIFEFIDTEANAASFLTGGIRIDTYSVGLGFDNIDVYRSTPNMVRGIELSQKELTINKNDSIKIDKTVKPANADNKNVTFSSSNTAAVEVDSDGIVTGMANGSAIITAVTEDGGFFDSCVVYVDPGELSTYDNITWKYTDNETEYSLPVIPLPNKTIKVTVPALLGEDVAQTDVYASLCLYEKASGNTAFKGMNIDKKTFISGQNAILSPEITLPANISNFEAKLILWGYNSSKGIIPDLNGATLSPVNANNQSRMINISGTVPEANKEVIVLVLKPLSGISDISSNTIAYQDIVRASGNNFSTAFSLPENSASGIYKVFINGKAERSFTYIDVNFESIFVNSINNSTTPAQVEKAIADSYDILLLPAASQAVYGALLNKSFKSLSEVKQAYLDAAAIEKINNATVSNMHIALSEIANDFGLQLSDGSLYDRLSDKTALYTMLFETNFELDKPDKLKKVFWDFVSLAAINNMIKGNFEENSALLEETNSIFELDLSGDFAKLSQAEKSNVADSLCGRSFSTASSVKAAFNVALEKAVLDTINNADATNRATIGQMLLDFNSYYKLSLTGGYSLLNESELAEVYKALQSSNFKDFDSIKPVFDNIVAELLAKRSSGSNSGSSPVRNGSGGGGSYSIPLNVQTPEPISESEPEKSGLLDSDKIAWAKESIEWLYNKGIIQGNEGYFLPENETTREEFVKMMVLAFSLEGKTENMYFADLNPNDWYYEYINIAYKNGIINGISEAEFGINQKITRQDMITVIYRALTSKGLELAKTVPKTEFYDSENIAEYAKEAITAMQEAGVIEGSGNNMVEPRRTALRAETAKILHKLLADR